MEYLDHGLAHDEHQRLALEARGLVARRDDAHHARPALGPRVEPVMVCGCCKGDGTCGYGCVHQPWCPRAVLAHHTLAAHCYAWYSLHTTISQFLTMYSNNQLLQKALLTKHHHILNMRTIYHADAKDFLTLYHHVQTSYNL